MADPMRIRAVSKDGVVNVKVLMSHEMETAMWYRHISSRA
jgi:hypothetical protein